MKQTRNILVIGLLLCAIIAQAQPRLDEQEIYIGAQAGIMASMITFDPNVKQSAKQPFTGINGGLIFRYAGHKVCGLQIELNYMQRGWHETETGYQRELDYIELPLLTHIYFGKRCRGYVNLGPQIGYCFRETTTPTLDFYHSAPFVSANVHQYVSPIENKFDWGVAGGIGFYARTRKAGVYQIEARFNYSLGTIYKNHQSDYFEQSNHMNLSLNIAYLWQIKGNN